MKKQILELLKKDLLTRIQNATEIAHQTHLDATNAELIQKSKYETQGIESSYLAQGHARRLAELNDDLRRFTIFESKEVTPTKTALVGSLILLEGESGGEELHFISPITGAPAIQLGSQKIKVVSEKSPLGSELIGRALGDTIELEVQKKPVSYLIRRID